MFARRVFLLLYLASGATALVYQVVWSRALALELGQTAAAIGTVLAAFMGGLAAGAALGGRYAPGMAPRTALARYAQLEAFIGASALLVAPALSAAQPLLVAAYMDGDGGWRFFLIRLLISGLVVVIPATAMGATLPLAIRWLERAAPAVPGRVAGVLYTANTAGAAAGAALAGFVLLPALGLWRTTVTAAAVNLAICGAALWVARRVPLPAAETPAPARPAGPRRRTAPGVQAAPALAALVLGLSGTAALLHEVAWTRVIALLVGPTTYAFSTMLTTFIVGLGIGGAAGTALVRRGRPALPLLGWAQALAAAAAVGATLLVPRVQSAIAQLVSEPGRSYGSLLFLESLVMFALLLPLTLAFGASFPLAVAAAAPEAAEAARPAARVYAWNTVGAIGGALAGGFLGLPFLGLRGTILAGAFIGLATAILIALRAPRSPSARMPLTGAAALVAAVAWVAPAWAPAVLAGGFYRPSTDALPHGIEAEAGSLLFYGDGPAGTVTVRRVAGQISLAINGKVDASNAGDMLTQKLLAHIPLLLHPDPRSVAIIGLGSGATAGAALVHPVSSVHTIELSRQVVAASAFFREENRDALADPRSRLVVGDGRSHLRLSRQAYDVIVSEPSNPWMAGIASLFTRELFQAARARLAPQGVFCQWAHTYEIGEDDLRSIVATFHSVFPDASVWLVGEGDLLLVGTADGSLARRLDGIDAAWRRPGVADDLASVRVRDPGSLLALYLGSDGDLHRFAAGAPVQTDDRMALEFSAPGGLYTGGSSGLAARLRQTTSAGPRPAAIGRAEQRASGQTYRNRASMFFGAHAYALAFECALEAARRSPGDEEAIDLLVRAAVPTQRVAEAAAALRQVSDRAADALPPRLGLARLHAATGRLDDALAAAAEAARDFPGEAGPIEQLASIAADAGDAPLLARAVADLERDFPGRPATPYYAATLRFLRQDYAAAAALGQQAVGSPLGARALNLVGASYASLGERDRARAAFQHSLDRDPRDPAGYLNLAQLELEAANPRRAAALYAEALVLDPSSAEARRGLDLARAQL